jgi:hypothetical protein
MPSQLHEVLVLLFKNRPELAPVLLREALHLELPAYTEVRLESAELTDVMPTEYRADLVVLLVHDKPVLGIVVEVQLSIDKAKCLTWPVYVTGLRARIGCDCGLLVITPSRRVAAWAARPIVVHAGFQLTPWVVGPAGVPIVTEPDKAKQMPELAVLSVMAHGKGDVQTAVKIALNASSAFSDLDEDSRTLYCDLIEVALGEAARKALAMLPATYQFQGPSYLKGKFEGIAEGELKGKLEGIAEGELKGEVEAVLAVLETRGVSVSDAERERIEACREPVTLKRWVRLAVTTRATAELFDAVT